MGEKQISRKEFFTKALTGIAGISLVSKNMTRFISSGVEFRAIGNTGIKVSPICFGAPRTNDESLIKYALERGINFIDTGRAYGKGSSSVGSST
jgi:diaminopimelate decarboxylase